jgi:hypothetical protein
MPRLEFGRLLDLPVVVRRVDRATARVESGFFGESIPIDEPAAAESAVAMLPLPAFAPAVPGQTALRRVTLDIRIEALHRWPWETWLANKPLDPDAIVRVSRVVPGVTAESFRLPLRIVVIDPVTPGAVDAEVRSVFGSHEPARVREAVVVGEAPAAALSSCQPPLLWPVADIVHLMTSPVAFDVDELAPILRVWQTRLLVLDARTEAEAERCRALGAALCARGGPAVIVRPAAAPPRPLYDRLVHDFPLDVLTVSRYGDSAEFPAIDALFGGAGREELARLSNAGKALFAIEPMPAIERLPARAFADTLDRVTEGGFDKIFEEVSGPKRSQTRRPVRRRLDFDEELGKFEAEWPNMHFEYHEGDGVLRLVDHVVRLRANARRKTPARTPKRFVNGTLWADEPRELRRVESDERLVIGAPYQLRVQIGPRDEKAPTVGSSELLEEKIQWRPEETGVWLDIAVNGVGFDVEGAPVRKLWLPRWQASDAVHFAVRPTRSPVAVVRYTIYCRENVVQTFRIAAIATTGGGHAPATSEERTALARALHVRTSTLPKDAVWASRMEFAGANIDTADSLPPRAISIVANDVNGERVVTVKGKKFFAAGAAKDLPLYVDSAREALVEGELIKTGKTRADWQYRLYPDSKKNEAELLAILPALAERGWQLYDQVIPYDEREAMEKRLDCAGEVISVAHTLLEDVIPWSMMYDRQYVRPPGGGNVCLAARPNADGMLPADKCDVLPSCLLKQGADPQSVACPLRFWGFRHVVELPPLQPVKTNDTPKRIDTIDAGSQITIATGLNTSLALANQHVRKLNAIQGVPVTWKYKESVDTDLLKALQDLDLDIIYLYCHARGGRDTQPAIHPPELEIEPGAKPALTSDRFNFKPFAHHPLVFLNGCHTAAFSPDALSPFVRKFVGDRKAAGMIGTEVPVHEILATDFALRFFERFLRGEQAGPAMLLVRRAMLAENNLLALIYTLYGVAELHLKAAKI